MTVSMVCRQMNVGGEFYRGIDLFKFLKPVKKCFMFVNFLIEF